MPRSPRSRTGPATTQRGWQVGTGGWTLITFAPGKAPPIADLRRWVTESFLLLVPKKVSARLQA